MTARRLPRVRRHRAGRWPPGTATRPMQSSDLYVTDGDEIDWMYGRHRIFSFTWELYPTETPSDATDHYSPDEIIARETKRNRAALLYTLRAAGCPYGAIDRQQANCGAVLRRLRGLEGLGAQPGRHRHRHRRPLAAGQPGADHDLWPPATARRDDLREPRARHRGGSRRVARRQRPRRHDHDPLVSDRPAGHAWGPSRSATTWPTAPNASPDDWFRVWVEAADGTRTLVREELGAADDDAAAWASARVAMDPWAGQTVRHRHRGRRRGHRQPRRGCRGRRPDRAAVARQRGDAPPAAGRVRAWRDPRESKNPGGRTGVLDVDIRIGCGEGIRTLDLRVMSPTSCRCSTPRPKYEPGRPNRQSGPSTQPGVPARASTVGPGRRPGAGVTPRRGGGVVALQ